MLIIIDTNVLFSDLFLEGASVRTLLAAENQIDTRLVISEVVAEELRRHVEERVEAAINEASNARRRIVDLTGSDRLSTKLEMNLDLKQIVLERFDQRIRQLKQQGRILKYPDASVRDIVHRSIMVQLPFQKGDKGLRDTLIWLTALECANQGSNAGRKIIVVTSDGAFWDTKQKMMRDELKKELQTCGLPADAITVLPNLQDVIKKFVSSKLQPAQSVNIAIESGRIDDFTTHNDRVLLEVADWLVEHFEILEIGEYLYVDYDIVEKVALRNIDRTFDLGDGLALVDTAWTCEVAAEGYYNRFMGDNLRLQLQFKLSSVINVEDDCFVVRSHEIGDVEFVDVIGIEHDVFLGEIGG